MGSTMIAGGPALVPIGTVLDYAGPGLPSGYLECDGSAVSRTQYSALFAAIGITWGAGDGSTTFNLPNLGGRVTLGKGSRSVGATGGSETHTLTVNEMPSHTHPESVAGWSSATPATTGGCRRLADDNGVLPEERAEQAAHICHGGGVSSQHHAALRGRQEGHTRRLKAVA